MKLFSVYREKIKLDEDVGTLRLKQDLYTGDEDEDNSKHVENFKDRDVENDDDTDGDDVEGSEEDVNNGSTGEEEYMRCISHGFHFFEGKMNHPIEDFVVAKTRIMNGYDFMPFLRVTLAVT